MTDIRFVFRHFPLMSIHRNAFDAAVATEIADKGSIFIKDAAPLTTYDQIAQAEEKAKRFAILIKC